MCSDLGAAGAIRRDISAWAERRSPPGAAQEAASPVELREKRIRTERQNWLSHSDTCTQIYNFPPYVMFFAQSKEQAA